MAQATTTSQRSFLRAVAAAPLPMAAGGRRARPSCKGLSPRAPAAAAAEASVPPLAFRGARGGSSPQQQQPQLRRRVLAAAQKQQFSSFQDMIQRSEVPVLVDFYATWCGPCQMMSSTLASVASKLKGRLQVVKIDTDRYPAIASQHKVQALPTIALFVGGKVVFRFEGVLQEAQLMDRLNHYLAGAGAGKQQQ